MRVKCATFWKNTRFTRSNNFLLRPLKLKKNLRKYSQIVRIIL